MRQSDKLAGGNPGLFQFDCDELPTKELGEWLTQQFDWFMEDHYDNLLETLTTLFESGKRLKLQVQLWFEPGYFLVIPLSFTFQYLLTARKDGKDVAPFQVECQSTFKFPILENCAYVGSMRFQESQQVDTILVSVGTMVVLMAMDKFLSEVVTS